MKKNLMRESFGRTEVLTFNTPEKLNVLSEEMLNEMQETLEEIKKSDSIRTVIFRANGKAFCAGHDLKQMQKARQKKDGGYQYYQDLFKKCGRIMLSIINLPQPVIAEVQGIATAAGCQLVASCDLAVASEKATFGVNGVNIGLFCSTPMVALSRNISRKKVFEMLVTGDFLNAEQALQNGLINKVVPEKILSESTFHLAEKINNKLGPVIKIGKKSFYQQSEMDLEKAYLYTAEVMATNMMLDDTAEGITAFIEKRSPDWSDP